MYETARDSSANLGQDADPFHYSSLPHHWLYHCLHDGMHDYRGPAMATTTKFMHTACGQSFSVVKKKSL